MKIFYIFFNLTILIPLLLTTFIGNVNSKQGDYCQTGEIRVVFDNEST